MPRAAAKTEIEPRLLRQPDAARYVGMSESKFCELVKRDVFPQGVQIDSIRLWDRVKLDRRIDRLFDEAGFDPFSEVKA